MNKSILKNLLAIATITLVIFGPTVADLSSLLDLNIGYDSAYAMNRLIRQEINIIDANMVAASSAYATSTGIVNLDSSKYTSGTYYFEVLASTTSATNATVSLVNATSSQSITSVTINGTTNARYRSSSFTPPGVATDYVVLIGNEAVGKGVLEARIVVLQSGSSISNTMTQIEIGNEELYTTTATSTFSSPKYWFYDSTKWDGSPTYYAEISYTTVSGMASTTAYKTAGTYTITSVPGIASTTVELIGGGGAGGGALGAPRPDGGAGGAGGQYAKKTMVTNGSGNHTLIVAATKAGTSGANGGAGNDSTWDTTTAVAKGGGGGLVGSGGIVASTTGNTTGCVGDVCFKGGDSAGGGSAQGGAGGAGAGTLGDGNSATNADVQGATTTNAGEGGGTKSVVTGANGTGPGSISGYGGGGGGGAYVTTNASRTGGTGGPGTATTTNYIATTTIVLQVDNGSFASWTDVAGTYMVTYSSPGAGTSTRVRSASFTPTASRNYRIAFKIGGANGVVMKISNAKIIVDQSSPTLLETQYLVANTKLFSGTALQNFLAYFDPAEWSATTTNVYKHEASSIAGGAGTSDVKLQDSTGSPDVTGSTITDIVEREQSSAMTMPTTAKLLGVIATTNGGDIYSSRILAQVNTDTVPDAPTSLVATPGTGKVTLTWAAPADDGGSTILNYEVVRKTSTGPTTQVDHLATTSAVLTYIDTAIANGTTYYYRVVAGNLVGTSTYSNEASTAPTEASASATRSSFRFLGGRFRFLGGRIKFF